MGKYQRIKGHTFEREIAKFFRLCGWKKASRNLREVQKHHAVRHHDLENTAPFAVQCKNTEAQASDRQLIKGTRLDPEKGFLHALLVRKRNRCSPTVTLTLEALDEILGALRTEECKVHLQDTTLVTIKLAEFKPLLVALRKAGLYPKDR